MRISLPDARIRVDGAAAVEESADGIRVHRLDPALAHQHPVEVVFVEGMGSGVRLVFDTDADSVTLRCTPMRLSMVGGHSFPATFDALVDGTLVDRVEADFGHLVTVDPTDASSDFEVGEAGDVVVSGLGSGITTVEIWLPHGAGVELHALTVPDGATVASAPSDARPRWMHHGSSISHCMEADGPSATWPAVAAAASGHHVVNLGVAGQCHVDQFAARTIRDLPAERISLKLGINVVNGDTMRMRGFVSAVHGFLDTVREGHPDTPLLVISPIHCPVAEDAPGPTMLRENGTIEATGSAAEIALGKLSVRRIRTLLAEIVEARVLAGDAHLSYLDGLELFGPDDVDDLPDGLHPNGAGYRRMGERFARHPFLAGSTDGA